MTPPHATAVAWDPDYWEVGFAVRFEVRAGAFCFAALDAAEGFRADLDAEADDDRLAGAADLEASSWRMTAWAAANRAIGTRYGEHET